MDNQNETKISVRVTPCARHNAVTAFRDGVWHIKIAAPPVEGKANERLIEFLSRTLDVRKSNLSVIKGQTGRSKLICISGLAQGEITLRLSAAIGA
jgi:uncharacterized protein (TIGR00251 family)